MHPPVGITRDPVGITDTPAGITRDPVGIMHPPSRDHASSRRVKRQTRRECRQTRRECRQTRRECRQCRVDRRPGRRTSRCSHATTAPIPAGSSVTVADSSSMSRGLAGIVPVEAAMATRSRGFRALRPGAHGGRRPKPQLSLPPSAPALPSASVRPILYLLSPHSLSRSSSIASNGSARTRASSP